MTSVIVCGVDRSEQARDTAQLAATLADRLKLTLLLVHVAAWPSVDPQTRRTPIGLEWATSEHRRDHERWLSEFASGLSGPRAQTRVEIGLPSDWLVAIAAAYSAALVVVGCQGASTRRSHGPSIAADLVRRTACPVMIVPPGVARGRGAALGGERIVCGVGAGKDAAAARLAARLADCLGLGLTLAHVLPDDRYGEPGPIAVSSTERLERVERSALDLLSSILDGQADAVDMQRERGRVRGPVELRLRRGNAGEQLSALATTEQTALIIVGSRGRRRLRLGLHDSVARHLATHGNVPVMICPSGTPTQAGVSSHVQL